MIYPHRWRGVEPVRQREERETDDSDGTPRHPIGRAGMVMQSGEGGLPLHLHPAGAARRVAQTVLGRYPRHFGKVARSKIVALVDPPQSRAPKGGPSKKI